MAAAKESASLPDCDDSRSHGCGDDSDGQRTLRSRRSVFPLGRAVVGGLIASTFAALFILPLAFARGQGKATTQSVSLDPED